ncbi:NAD-dependent epimerase/dehydratase family protein [Aeromonas enteropelogenes]|uniref:NAD-dependent epimerase/dehydratase family protein n=1 Tax=Aeromonas enteropelogenes TaxID=29489 RepID=UPI0009E32661|nr:NAD-dependent epimerase/dehydratase family protein [Aeromonas enteropelogenes]UBH57730.1 NAD-dependent epimerase/dehydratase family protein [Aeromonas enteropelogenes]
MKEKILITGASGYIGSSLVQHLKDDLDIIPVCRHSSKNNIDTESFVISDISSNTDWSRALKGVSFVVHLAALAHNSLQNTPKTIDYITEVNVNASVNLFRQAEKAGVKRFIFVSSIGVIGNQTQDVPFDEDSECNPIGAYAYSKYQAEKILRKIASHSKTELVIIRPPLVFSPSAPGNIAKLSKIIKYCPILPFGSVNNKKSFVSIENLVNFLELCVFSPDAAGQVFVISDDRVWSTKQLIQALADAEGRKIYLIPISVTILRFLFILMGKRNISNQLFGNLLVNNSKARRLLLWKPII